MTTNTTLSDTGFVSRTTLRDAGPGSNHPLALNSCNFGPLCASRMCLRDEGAVLNSNSHTLELEIDVTHCKQTTAATSNGFALLT
jgi:hypothetical protein